MCCRCCGKGAAGTGQAGAVQAQGTSAEAVPSSFGEFAARGMQLALHASSRTPGELGGRPRTVDGLKLQEQTPGLSAPGQEARQGDGEGVGEPGWAWLGAG